MPPEISRTMSALLAEAREFLPRLTMFEIEHNLCEWDKYCRIATGETRGQSFKPLILEDAA
jgi:hypothetical protein